MKYTPYFLRHLLFCLALFSPLAVSLSWAQNFPAKPVKFINSFPPGGPVDIIARSLAEAMQQSLKQVFVVENRAGAGGNLGADMVAKSPPDGYTVLFGLDTTFTVNPSIYKNSPYKLSDLKPVMIMASSGLLIGVNPSTNIKTMNDLIARGRSQGLTFSSASNGSPGHLALEILGDLAQIKITHIPYKGNTPAVAAIISGEVDGAVLATPGMLPFVKAQKMNALAVTSLKRSRLALDVPTVSEVGLKDLALEVFYVAMVPAATPQELVSVLQQSMADALTRPDLKARLESLDLVILSEIGVAASQHLESLRNSYAPIIKSTGMQIE
jgi:tripartite-type tricarboxylate transporter receptor subunit TctC